MHTPGLMCRIEANQYRGVDFRVLQAEVQLTCNKWGLKATSAIYLVPAHK